jgi:hypothetical protein
MFLQWFELLVFKFNMRKTILEVCTPLVVKYGAVEMDSGFSSIFIFFLNAADAKINPWQYLSPHQALEPDNYFLGRETRSKRASTS